MSIVYHLEPNRCKNGHILYFRDCTNFNKKKGFNCSNNECKYFTTIVYITQYRLGDAKI